MSAFRLAAAAALALFLPSTLSAQPEAVQTVTLYSFGYSPKTIELRAGRPVTLVFANRAGSRHDFTARAFFSRARILSGNDLGGEIDLAAGERKSITLVPAAGRYKVHCGKFFHKQMGMSGTIVVR